MIRPQRSIEIVAWQLPPTSESLEDNRRIKYYKPVTDHEGVDVCKLYPGIATTLGNVATQAAYAAVHEPMLYLGLEGVMPGISEHAKVYLARQRVAAPLRHSFLNAAHTMMELGAPMSEMAAEGFGLHVPPEYDELEPEQPGRLWLPAALEPVREQVVSRVEAYRKLL